MNRKEIYSIWFLVVWITIAVSCKSEQITEQPNINADSSLTDFEGNVYKVKKIGNSFWMVENFRALKSSDGQVLANVYSFNNDNNLAIEYGRLYTWNAAVESTPSGWHLPAKEEWEELFNSFGGSQIASGRLKEIGREYWNSPNTGATNASEFSAVGSGFRGPDGVSYDLKKHGSYWGSANDEQEPFCVYLYYNSANVISEISPTDKTSGIAFAVRYVKN